MRLRVAVPGTAEYEVSLTEGATIGRASSADVTLLDPALSRHHARLAPRNGDWLLEDLGSRNGTTRNGQSVSGPVLVRPGDEIVIGGSRLTVLPDPDSSESFGTSVRMLPEAPLEGTLFRSAADLMAGLGTSPSSRGDEDRQALVRFTERLKLMNEVHSALGHFVSLEELLGLILDRAFEHLKPEQAAVFLKDGSGEYRVVAARSLPGVNDELRLSRSLVHEVCVKGMAALVLDTGTDERFAGSESLLLAGIRSLLAAPLLDPDGALGMIVLASKLAHRTFKEEDLELLLSLASVAALKIKNASLAEEAVQRRRLEAEVALARKIQVALLPSRLPEIPGYTIHAKNIPSRGVSGDYYEVRQRSGGAECILFVADVAGKGIAASLLTASLEALSEAPLEDGLPPDEVCEKLSRGIYRRTPPEKYATAFLAILEPESGRLRYTNAGHNPALVVRSGFAVERLAACGPPIGILSDATYRCEETFLLPGETLLMYTDGITEATDPHDEEYGIERLEALLASRFGESVEQLAAALDTELNDFVKGVPFADDRTVVLLQRKPSANDGTVPGARRMYRL